MYVIAHGGRIAERGEAIGALHVEDKVVVEVKRLGGKEIARGRLDIINAPQVHVHRGAGVQAEAKVERQRPFEQPAVGRDGEQASQQALKRDRFTQAYDGWATTVRSQTHLRFEGGPERGGGGVAHARPPCLTHDQSGRGRAGHAARPPHADARGGLSPAPALVRPP